MPVAPAHSLGCLLSMLCTPFQANCGQGAQVKVVPHFALTAWPRMVNVGWLETC